MPSFDAVLEPNLVELRNAVDQSTKEITTRFDFKGSSAAVELDDGNLALYADNDFQLDQVKDVVLARLARRGVDVRFLDLGEKPQKLGGDRLRLAVPVKSGIGAEPAKKIQQALKASKLKVQAAHQGDSVRVSGAKRDDLQAAIALIRKEIADLPLAFKNMRD
jgi:cyclic-di-GMP-binding protein